MAASPSCSVKYARVVVPLDGSALAEQALLHALTLAQALAIPIHLVRIVDTSGLSFIGPGMAIDQASFAALLQATASEEQEAADYLASISQRLASTSVTVSTAVRGGPIVEELLAMLQPGDLIVMTTHGRTGLARWFLGSVAEAVLRRATVPVLIIRSSATSHPEEAERSDALQKTTPAKIPDPQQDKEKLDEHKDYPSPGMRGARDVWEIDAP